MKIMKAAISENNDNDNKAIKKESYVVKTNRRNYEIAKISKKMKQKRRRN